jgi:hypothetical protein
MSALSLLSADGRAVGLDLVVSGGHPGHRLFLVYQSSFNWSASF